MTLYYGAWEYSGGNGMRMAFDITNTSVSSGSSSVTFTVKVYTQNQYHYSDPQVISYGGGLSGSTSFTNSQGSNSGGSGLDYRATKTYTYNYPSTSYGSSPGKATLSASLSGAYNGVTPSVSVAVTIPARPYSAPNAPSGCTSVRNSDAQATVSWTRNPTSQRPYTSLTVQMATYTGSTWSGWSTIATTSATANSYVKTGLSANRVYRFQVRANNSVGSSGFVSAGYIYMTPAAPSDVASSITSGGSTITTSWTDNAYTEAHVTWTVERSVNGAAYASVATGLAQGTTTWVDSAPGAGTNTYRVKAVQSLSSTSSAYGTGNTVTTIVPPLAPTNLSPNGVTVDLSKPVTLTWQHNPGGDGAPQSAFQIDYSPDGGTTWNPLSGVVNSAVSSWTMPGGTLGNGTPRLWRVRTLGIASGGYGPNSSSATITGSATPVVAITAPTATTAALPLTASWTYTQANGSAQSQWWASLYAADGVTLLEYKTGAGAATSVTFAFPVEDATTYKVNVQVRSAAGILSNVATATTTVSLPVPAAVDIVPEYQECTGTVILHLSGSDPAPLVANRTNLVTNPAMRATTGNVEARRNLVANPALRTTTGPSVMRTNYATNPRFAQSGGTVEVRRNYATDPRITTASWNGVAAGGLVNAGVTQFYSPNVTAAVGETWTVSIDLTNNTGGSVSGAISVGATTGAAFGSNARGSTGWTVANGATARLADTFTLQAGADGLRVLMTITSGVSSGLKIDKVLIEKVGGAIAYFDGASVDRDGLDYQWTGTANASASIAVGSTVTGYNASSTLKVWRGADGASMRILQTGAVGGFVEQATGQVPAAAGDYWTISVDVFSPTNGYTATVGWASAGGTATAASLPDFAVTTLRTRKSVITSAMPTSTTSVRMLFTPKGPVGSTYTLKSLLVEKVLAALPYFDGTTSPDAELGFTYAWGGTADASVSNANSTLTTWAASLKGYGRAAWTLRGEAEDGTDTTLTYVAGVGLAQPLVLFSADAPAAATGDVVWGGYRARLRHATNDVTLTPFLWGYTSASVGVGSIAQAADVVVPATGEWVDIVIPPAAITGAGVAQARHYTKVNGSFTGETAILEISNVIVEKARYVAGWFDGNQPATTDLTYGWSSTPDQSPAIATGKGVAGASTNGVGWQYTSDDGRKWLTSVNAGYLYLNVAGSPGSYYAARVTVAGPPGTPFLLNTTDNVVGSWAQGPGTLLLPDSGEMTVVLPAGPASEGTAMSIGLTGWNSQMVGLRFTDVLVEKVRGYGDVPSGGYFDGSTNDISTFTYGWSGAADASTSVATSRAEIDVASVTVERRIEGGDWVQLVSGLAVPNDFVDTVPLTNGLNEYRVTAASAAPSYRVMDPVSVEGTDGQQGYGKACGGLWAFLSYGPGFSSVLRTHSDLSISETAARAKSLQPYLGRKKPGMLIGTNVERKVELKGRLHYGDPKPVDDPCRYDSPPEDWTAMGEEADIVCYRDYTGRRIFGMLSEVATNEIRWGILGDVSLSVTETEYVEEYGAA